MVQTSARKERATINQGELQLKHSYLSDLRATLVEGSDGSGYVSEAALAQALSTPEVSRCFQAHGMDFTEAAGMLKLLGHRSHTEEQHVEISVDEFIVGLLLLKDEGRKEMVTVWYENNQLLNKMFTFMHFT